jgi:prepilin-type processing-associated H-X9-DG protein
MFPPHLGANRPEEKRWPVHVFENAKWNPQILKCPADDPNPVNDHSYLLNDNLTIKAIRANTTHTDTGLPSTQIILMGEKVTTEDDYYMNPQVKDYIGVVEYYRHGASYGSNYLFLDGHVETVMPQLANSYIDPWDPNKPVPKGTTR